MAGLLNQPKDEATGAAAAGGGTPPVGPAEVPDDEGGNVSPEEQEAYEDFVLAGMELLFAGGKAKPEIVKLLDDDPSDIRAALGDVIDDETWAQKGPIAALAAASVIVVSQVIEQMGSPPEASIVFHGGKELLEQIAELGEKAGIRDYSEAELGEAFRMGADLYREVAKDRGWIDEEEAKAEFEGLKTAEKEGRLGEILPELAQGETGDGGAGADTAGGSGGARPGP
jgi:hypothetical protein